MRAGGRVDIDQWFGIVAGIGQNGGDQIGSGSSQDGERIGIASGSVVDEGTQILGIGEIDCDDVAAIGTVGDGDLAGTGRGLRSDDNVFTNPRLAAIGRVIDKDDPRLQRNVSFNIAVEDVIIIRSTVDGHVDFPATGDVVGVRVDRDVVITAGSGDIQEGNVVNKDRIRTVEQECKLIGPVGIRRVCQRIDRSRNRRVHVLSQDDDFISLIDNVSVVITDHIHGFGSIVWPHRQQFDVVVYNRLTGRRAGRREDRHVGSVWRDLRIAIRLVISVDGDIAKCQRRHSQAVALQRSNSWQRRSTTIDLKTKTRRQSDADVVSNPSWIANSVFLARINSQLGFCRSDTVKGRGHNVDVH